VKTRDAEEGQRMREIKMLKTSETWMKTDVLRMTGTLRKITGSEEDKVSAKFYDIRH
jgi:hypothetical protein